MAKATKLTAASFSLVAAMLLQPFSAFCAPSFATPGIKPGPEEKCEPFSGDWAPLSAAGCKAKSVPGMTCAAKDYKNRDNSACTRCEQVVSEWKDKIQKTLKDSAAKDGLLSGATALLTGATSAKTDGAAADAAGAAKKVNAEGEKGQNERAKNAKAAQSQFKQCQAEVQKACRNLTEEDRTAPEKINEACAEADKGAGKLAKDKNKNGDAMKKAGDASGDIMKALGALAPLAQALAKKDEESPTDQSAQYPENNTANAVAEEAPALGESKLAENDQGATPLGAMNGVGFGAPSKTPEVVASSGSGLTGLSTTGFDPSEGFGGAGALAEKPEAPGPSTGAVGGGGSGGGGSGGGASQPSEGPAVAELAKDLGFEISGGGGTRSSVNGKSSKGEPDPVPESSMSALEEPPLEEYGDREPASEENAALDENDDGSSIFMRVRSRYATLKGAGRI